MIDIPVIETERLRLRGPQVTDFDAYAAVFASERSRFIGGPKSRRGAWDEFAGGCAAWLLRGFGFWSVDTLEKGELVGWVGIVYPDRYEEPELGWVLVEAFEGRRYAQEAAIAARAYAGTHFGLERLVSFISVGNTRSIRLAERLGTHREETRGTPEDRFHVYRHPGPEALQ